MATRYPKQYNQSSRYVPPKSKWPKQYGQSATYIAPNGQQSNALPGAHPQAAGPPAPAAPAGPQAQALPFDATYDGTVANNERTYENTISGLQYTEGATRQEYGFDDVSNPFNRAAMLQQAYQRGTASRLNQAGASMYSSAFNAGETEGRSQYDQNYGNLRSEYDAKLNKIAQDRAQAAIDRDQGNTMAYGDRLSRVPAAEDPGPPAAPAAAAGGRGAPGRVLRPGERPPPVHRGNQGTLTAGRRPQRPGTYARRPKRSKYAGRVM
jgi:hypothetical protein